MFILSYRTNSFNFRHYGVIDQIYLSYSLNHNTLIIVHLEYLHNIFKYGPEKNQSII
jgi:hypothetical protein